MNIKIFAVNLIVPVFVILVIAAITGCFRIKKKDSIKSEVFECFKQAWEEGEPEPATGEESFFQKFFRLFVQAYEYEEYKESANRAKFYFYKMLVLFIILCIPFLVLFLITRKEWILNDSEWNDIYLYTVILVPVIFAYLVNKYIRIGQYHETWYRHLQTRHHMEWRMMEFVKDCELAKAGLNQPEEGNAKDSLKIGFINDLCEYWKAASDGISAGSGVKDDNLFSEIGSLFGKD